MLVVGRKYCVHPNIKGLEKGFGTGSTLLGHWCQGLAMAAGVIGVSTPALPPYSPPCSHPENKLLLCP